MHYPYPVRKLTGTEQFKNTGDSCFTVQEFWSYSYSNLGSNILRGLLAKFIVLKALKNDTSADIRDGSKGFDILYNDKQVEVKCSSYLKGWGEMRHSGVIWTELKADDLYYRPKTKLDPDGTIAYEADIYVLALLAHKDHATLDVMDMSQWCFYVLTRKLLKEIFGNKNSLSLSQLDRRGDVPVSFAGLRAAVDRFCEPITSKQKQL